MGASRQLIILGVINSVYKIANGRIAIIYRYFSILTGNIVHCHIYVILYDLVLFIHCGYMSLSSVHWLLCHC